MCQNIGEEVCSSGYGSLSDIHKIMLRRIVLDKIGTAEEIDVLAAMLLASASQAGANGIEYHPPGTSFYKYLC